MVTPEQAREYIKTFSTHTIKGAEYVDMSGGERIHFNNMTDQQAVRVACALMDMELEAAERRKSRKAPNHG